MILYLYNNFKEAKEAIVARIDGEWDNPQLLKLGELHSNAIEDIKRILNSIKE